MIELIIIIVLGVLSSGLGLTTGRGCYLQKKFSKSVGELKVQNEQFQTNVNVLKSQNRLFKTNMSSLETQNRQFKTAVTSLENQNEQFDSELKDLKNMCNIVGETNEKSYEKLKSLYQKYKAIVNLDIKTLALKILLDLDENSDFVLDQNEKDLAKKKLQLLFSKYDLEQIPDEHFDDFTKLQESIEQLLHKNV